MSRKTFTVTPEENNTEEIINKGLDVYEVDIDDVRIILKKLVPYSQSRVCDLTGDTKNNFTKIVDYVNCFYENGTYEDLHKVIQDEFRQTKKLVPGTVASYMIGCAASSDVCSPTCVHAAPLPNHKPCNEKVILATSESGKYVFIPLNDIKSTRAILYIPHDNFLGLSKEEKDKLIALGILNVHVKGAQNLKNVPEFTSGYVPVEEVLHRDENLSLPSSVSETISATKSSYNLAFLLLIIIVILVLLFVAWKSWR